MRIEKLEFKKIRSFCSVKDTEKRMKNKPQTERKYVQKTYYVEDHYPKYIKNS